MNKQSNPTVPLYNNVTKSLSNNLYGYGFESSTEPKITNSIHNISNIMRYIENDFPIEHYSFEDDDDELSIGPLTDIHLSTSTDSSGNNLIQKRRRITGVSKSFTLLNSTNDNNIMSRIISNDSIPIIDSVNNNSNKSNSFIPITSSDSQHSETFEVIPMTSADIQQSETFEVFNLTNSNTKTDIGVKNQYNNGSKVIKANCAYGRYRNKSPLMYDQGSISDISLENIPIGIAETLDPLLRKRVIDYKPRNKLQIKDYNDKFSQEYNDSHCATYSERHTLRSMLNQINKSGDTSLTKDIGYEQQRIYDIMNVRMKLAKKHSNDIPLIRPITFQERYVNIYSKGLPHDEEGFVNKDEMMKLIIALEEKDSQKLSKINLGGKLKLVNPSAAWSSDIIGACNSTYRYSRLPGLSSDFIASEMSELYCMSLARDIPFSQYSDSSIIEDCCGYLNKLKKYPQVDGKVTPYNIFRGPMYGDLQGPYISQFLYRDLKMGGFMQKQKYTTDLEGYDFMKTWETAISAQNGNILESAPPTRSNPRYLITGRDLACYVHNKGLFQIFYDVCTLLIDLKVPMNVQITKLLNDNPTENMFINFGLPDILSTLTIIGRNALLAAWYVKWNSLFLRPEALSIEVERVYRNNQNIYRISPELLRNPVLESIRSKNGNVLLSQAYPEGSPLHPSFPSGNSSIAGACGTTLKFFFDTRHEIDVYEPDKTGHQLVQTGLKTTIGDEINKLVSNISIGSNWAGFNYHMSAISGIKRGQKVAISCLHDLIHRYPTDINISLQSFNNKTVTIEHKC